MEKPNESDDAELERLFTKLKQLKVRNGSESCPSKVAKQSRLRRTMPDLKTQDAVHKTVKGTDRKCIIRGTKLKLARTLASYKAEKFTTETGEPAEERTDKKYKRTESSSCIKRSCSMEFRNSEQFKHGCNQDDIDNTTPDELAGYMEQILHLPKPMSAMAEMMYG